MAWIRVVPPDEARGELAEIYRTMMNPDGSVDHILTVHSLNPPSLRAHHDLYRVCMYGKSELSRAQREIVAVAVSTVNRCHY